jgi:hypothetical protein
MASCHLIAWQLVVTTAGQIATVRLSEDWLTLGRNVHDGLVLGSTAGFVELKGWEISVRS